MCPHLKQLRDQRERAGTPEGLEPTSPLPYSPPNLCYFRIFTGSIEKKFIRYLLEIDVIAKTNSSQGNTLQSIEGDFYDIFAPLFFDFVGLEYL